MTLNKIKNQLSNNNIRIAQVVAFDNNHCIGKNNTLAWHIPEDLKYFKELTNNGVVIMGRKTFESIGKPLPNRINWVITTDKNWTADGIKIAHSLEQALEQAGLDVLNNQNKELFIIGGGQIYKQTLPISDTLYVTKVDLTIDGDTFYPQIDNHFKKVWQSELKQDKNSGTYFTFISYQRLD